ncbi:MAG: GNAT family N-acetyltransferase [Chloroflexia bacterium]|nr:GNAT family N-acetyltransferase [Chloroflexia bacterium]
MSIRSIKLPEDLVRIGEIAAEVWHYPDHPEWSVQLDEEESLADSMEKYQRIWPFVRLIQFLAPGLRDFLHGHVWEQEGRIAGFTQLNRRGTTATWYISAVGVHPDFRRRGIARKLVEAGIDLVRERGGRQLSLDVIEGNVPAIKLYESLGFENYSANLLLELAPNGAPPLPALPEGYLLNPTDPFTWPPRFELMKRITPQSVSRYEPVEPARYKRPFLTRLLFPLLVRTEGLQVHHALASTTAGQGAAYLVYEIRTRETGRNSITIDLDPNHAQLAPYLFDYALHQVRTANPDRVVEMQIPLWQEALTEAAHTVGFELRAKLLTLGLLL